MLFTVSGMVGLVRVLALSARATSGVAGCSFLSSGVYRANSKTAQYKAMVELEPSQVQLIRAEYPITLLYREDYSFLLSRHYPGGHRTSRGECAGHLH